MKNWKEDIWYFLFKFQPCFYMQNWEKKKFWNFIHVYWPVLSLVHLFKTISFHIIKKFHWFWALKSNLSWFNCYKISTVYAFFWPCSRFAFGLQSIPLVLQSIARGEKWNRLCAKVELAASQSGIHCMPKWNLLQFSANFAESWNRMTRLFPFGWQWKQWILVHAFLYWARHVSGIQNRLQRNPLKFSDIHVY